MTGARIVALLCLLGAVACALVISFFLGIVFGVFIGAVAAALSLAGLLLGIVHLARSGDDGDR